MSEQGQGLVGKLVGGMLVEVALGTPSIFRILEVSKKGY